MAGIFLDEEIIKTSVQKWMNNISRDKAWEGNNIHIDEIESLNTIKRSEWVNVSFSVLKSILTQTNLIDSLILFLHFDLNDSFSELMLNKLTLSWLKDNIGEYTPPSYHLTSVDYYNEFYDKELIRCESDDSFSIFIDSSKLDFFYRTYFDENEGMYSREIYVFVKSNLE